MASEQHPIAAAVFEADRLLREAVTDPARMSRERFRLEDERHLLASVRATIGSLQQLTESLARRVPSATSRGALDNAARRLDDLLPILRDGENKASEGNN